MTDPLVTLVENPPWRVTVKPVDAAGCAALGCTEGGDVVRVDIPGVEDRVLCRHDAGKFIQREATQ